MQIIHENNDNNLKIAHFIKGNLHQLTEFAGEEGNSYLILAPIVIRGIEKASIRDGKIGVAKMRVKRHSEHLQGRTKGVDGL